jgi:hypothetical protein
VSVEMFVIYPTFAIKLLMRLDALLQAIKYHLTYSSGTKNGLQEKWIY